MFVTSEKIGNIAKKIYSPKLQGSSNVLKALDLMDEYGVDIIGIECESDFIGIFKRDDFEKNVIRRNLNPKNTCLYEVATLSPPYVAPNLPANQTYRAMLAYDMLHMPVVAGRKLVGIISRHDLQSDEFNRNKVIELESNEHFGYNYQHDAVPVAHNNNVQTA